MPYKKYAVWTANALPIISITHAESGDTQEIMISQSTQK